MRASRLAPVLPLEVDAPYTVRHSARAKHLQAVVRGGRIEIVVPGWARDRHVRAFLDRARPWMLEKAALLATGAGAILPPVCEGGARVLLQGRPRTLRVETTLAAAEPRVELADEITVRLPTGAARDREPLIRATLLGWLKEQARQVAEGLIERYAPKLGKAPSGLRIKAQKTLWGSCGGRGVIHLNWRLIGAPPEVFGYIVVHELCHLRERNHGPKFWRLVGELMPDYERHKSWLRSNGSLLG
jgi:predicted metal-dependent hydrolase